MATGEKKERKTGLRELLLDMLVLQQKTVLLLVELRDGLVDDNDEDPDDDEGEL